MDRLQANGGVRFHPHDHPVTALSDLLTILRFGVLEGGYPPYLGRVEKTDGEEMRVPEEE